MRFDLFPGSLTTTTFVQAVEEDSSFDKFRYMSDFLTVQDDPLFEQFHAFSLSRCWIRSMNAPRQEQQEETASGGGKGGHLAESNRGGGGGGNSSPTSGGGSGSASEVQFTAKERQAMQNLPNEEYLVESGSREVRVFMAVLLLRRNPLSVV